MYIYINQQAQMDALYNDMAQTDHYALDTEFIKVDTLKPILGLLQLNVSCNVYVLDGKTLDLTDLWAILFNARRNTFHACGEDLDLIHYYADQKPLSNVFDTQVGLSFLGHGLQLSYQQALHNELGIDIDKGETRSDWLARPLRTEQLQYAANDVIHLPQLASTLEKKLTAQGLWQFTLDDCNVNAREIARDIDIQTLYESIGTFRHTRLQLIQLQQLAAWREHLARATNQPRGFILKNSTLLDMVDTQPNSCQQLQVCKDLHSSIFKEYSRTILDLLYRLPPKDQWPSRLLRPFRPRDNTVMQITQDIAQRVSAETHVPLDVLLRKKWLSQMFHATALGLDEKTLPQHLLGWRYDILTRPIMQVLHRHQALIAAEMSPLNSSAGTHIRHKPIS